jgi:hypothetical protein
VELVRLVDEIVAVPGVDFLNDGARVMKVAVTSSAVHSDSMPAANINAE